MNDLGNSGMSGTGNGTLTNRGRLSMTGGGIGGGGGGIFKLIPASGISTTI